MNLEILARLGLDLHEGFCFNLVSSLHSFSCSKFVIGRLLFVLVFHVGVFVFAFFSKSRFPLKFSKKVTEIRTQTYLQTSYIVVNIQGCNSS